MEVLEQAGASYKRLGICRLTFYSIRTVKEEADRMFGLLSEGGEVTMPMAVQFWGDYFGMCTDKFGIRWMLTITKRSNNY